MFKKIFFIIIIILSLITITSTYNNNNSISKKYTINIKKNKLPTGKIYIEKIGVNNYLYSKNSKENNIEENITILNESTSPEKENSIMILAAHSGIGKIAYFENLDKLTKDDPVILEYNNKKYEYVVTKKYEETKNGYIHIKESTKKQLILTTCSPNKSKKQLIVICTLKES